MALLLLLRLSRSQRPTGHPRCTAWMFGGLCDRPRSTLHIAYYCIPVYF